MTAENKKDKRDGKIDNNNTENFLKKAIVKRVITPKITTKKLV